MQRSSGTIRWIFPLTDNFSYIATSPDYAPNGLFFFNWNGNLPNNLEGERVSISEREGLIFRYQTMDCLNGDIFTTKISKLKANYNSHKHEKDILEAQGLMLNWSRWSHLEEKLHHQRDFNSSSNLPTNSA